MERPAPRACRRPLRRTGLRGASLLACALAVAAIAAPSASAHPLGNFSVNKLSQVRISEDAVRVNYILDLAEIPTFQQVQRYDADGDGAIGGAEVPAYLDGLLEEVASGLKLTVDGSPLALGAAADAALEFPAGQGGLQTSRVEASFQAALPPGADRVDLADESFSDRVGWKAIQVQPGEGTDVRSSVPLSDPTDGLRAYPEDLLESPLDVREAGFTVSEGEGTVSAPDGEESSGVTSDRAQDGFAGTLTSGDASGWLLLGLLAAAFGWGALHALSPGHGKAMVAGYLVGSRGTPKHAVILGATVTITHTAIVFLLGLVTLAASAYILPEQLYPWLGVASGVMVVVVGLSVMRTRFRRWREMRAEAAGGEGSDHLHSHDHVHSHDDGPDHSHDHGHSHGHGHSHHPPDDPLSMRGLLALGVSGGLVPCPSALVVLIAAISQHRVGLGMALILAFSLGLAATLMAVGLSVLYGGRMVERLRPERRLFEGRLVGALPALSASIIVAAGTLITLRAVPELG